MRSVEEVLTEKELQRIRVSKEVEALRIVVPLLAEDADLPTKLPAQRTPANAAKEKLA